MFNRILETAFDQASEVILKIKHHSCESYTGKIQSLDADFITLFQSDEDGGILWAFKRKDIAFCGLIVELPEQLKEIDLLGRVIN